MYSRKNADITQFAVIAILFLTNGSVTFDRMASLYLGPYLVKEFSLSASQIGMLASATSICWAISALLFGAISDRIGRRPVLIPAVFAFSLCSVLSGMAHSFSQLLMARALLGFTEGPCFSVLMALADEHSPPEHRGRNIGIVTSAGGLAGAAIGPVFTTQMADAFGWQWGFYGAAIPGMLSGLLLLLFVKEPKRINEANAERKPSLRDFVQLIRYRNLWLCSIAGFNVSVALFSFSTFAPLYITQTMRQTPTLAGYLMGATGLGGFAWTFLGLGLADRIGRKRTLSLFALLAVAEPIVFLAPAMYRTPWLLAAAASALMIMPAAAAVVLFLIPAESVPRHLVAAAIGFGAIGADFFGATVAPVIGGALGDAYGFSAPMLMASAGALMVVAVSFGIQETLLNSRSPAEKAEGVSAA